jgi:hypothetical protein
MDRNVDYDVRGPGGFELSAKSDDSGLLAGIPAGKVGEYRFTSGGGDPKTVGVGLLDGRETGLKTVGEIRFPEDLTVAAATETIRSDWPLWPIFATLGFCVLIVEWWYFHRRPGGLAVR